MPTAFLLDLIFLEKLSLGFLNVMVEPQLLGVPKTGLRSEWLNLIVNPIMSYKHTKCATADTKSTPC